MKTAWRMDAAKRLRLWNIGFLLAFALLGLMGGWWAVLITRLVNQNYELELLLGGSAAELALHHGRQRLMVMGESSLLLALAVTLISLAWRQAQRERAHIRRLEGMLAASSHELKTPVAAIRSLLESLQSGVLPPERAGPYLVRGLDSCHRLEHLIESILTYQAAVARPQPLSVSSLQEWIGPILDHRRESLPTEVVQVDLGTAGTMPVRAAADPLRVILENLLDNASKYAKGAPVAVSAAVDGPWVEVLVVDQGQGFPPEQAELLFEPYQRGSREQSRHGTGLGLYLSRTLAHSLGGDLRAQSDGPGKGACFRLRLQSA